MSNKYPSVSSTNFDEDVKNYGVEIAKEREMWRAFDDFKAQNPGRDCFIVNAGTSYERFESQPIRR